MKVALISCSKNKMPVPCPARVMYSKSSLFKKTLTYCENSGYELILVLSAKYNLLKLDDVIEPYEVTLNTFSKDELRTWGQDCFEILQLIGIENSEFDFYAGKIYYRALAKFLPFSSNVLDGLGIGERLRFLNKANIA